MNKKIFAYAVRLLFIFLFFYTASSKLLEARSFVLVLKQSPLIGNNAALVAWSVPTIELVTALFLVFPKTQKIGMLVSFCLMLLFTMYIGYMIIYTPHLPCTCGGVTRYLTWREHLCLNIALLILSGNAIYFQKREKAENLLKE
ncbi:MAG: hypothetical protein I8H66_13405 [Sphingobacteriia bacterium]|nr:hypothetical protein [Sphingobacteriia bacterium]